MSRPSLIATVLSGALTLAPLAGCESVPAVKEPQATTRHIAQGVSTTGPTTLASAAIPKEDHRVLAPLIGGALGAGGGYLIGVSKDKLAGPDKKQQRENCIKASQRAEKNPAKPDAIDSARSADLNEDGFLTLDEVVAMPQANLSEHEMIDRLRRTGQVFELTDYQEDYLRTRGVSDAVVRELRGNPQDLARTASDTDAAAAAAAAAPPAPHPL